jgi:hypothetical protein
MDPSGPPPTARRPSGAYRLLKSRTTTVAKSYTHNLTVYFPVKRLRSLAAGLFAGLLVSAPACCQAYVPSSCGKAFTMTREQLIKVG